MVLTPDAAAFLRLLEADAKITAGWSLEQGRERARETALAADGPDRSRRRARRRRRRRPVPALPAADRRTGRAVRARRRVGAARPRDPRCVLPRARPSHRLGAARRRLPARSGASASRPARRRRDRGTVAARGGSRAEARAPRWWPASATRPAPTCWPASPCARRTCSTRWCSCTRLSTRPRPSPTRTTPRSMPPSMRAFWDAYAPGDAGEDPEVSPLRADLGGFPPTLRGHGRARRPPRPGRGVRRGAGRGRRRRHGLAGARHAARLLAPPTELAASRAAVVSVGAFLSQPPGLRDCDPCACTSAPTMPASSSRPT